MIPRLRRHVRSPQPAWPMRLFIAWITLLIVLGIVGAVGAILTGCGRGGGTCPSPRLAGDGVSSRGPTCEAGRGR